MSKADKLILVFILLIAFIFRLYKINTPLADLHSWRQVDTAAVARNFERYGFNLYLPRYDDISSNQTGYENPQGLRMVEFPIYNATFAFLHRSIPYFSLEIWGRLVTAVMSLFIIAAIYILCLKEEDRTTALFASLTYAIFPFFVFFSRVILPETTALAFTMLSILFLYFYIHGDNNKKYIHLTASAILFALALLAKPTAIFYGVTLFFLFFQSKKIKILKSIPFYLFFAISLVPLILWRKYIGQYPEGIPASSWLITNVNTYEGMKNIFFKPAFFRWIFYERLTNIVFGGYLTFFFVLGLLKKSKNSFFLSLVLSAAAYLFTFQGGNVQHEYYQTLIFPALAIAVGRGISFINEYRKNFISPVLLWTICLAVWISAFVFSWYRVQEFYRYPNDLVQIARVISTLTDKNDLVVTDRLGDTTLLYLANRRGAPSKYKPLEELKKLGYSYYVTQNSEEIKNLKQDNGYKDKVVFENTQGDIFAVFKL